MSAEKLSPINNKTVHVNTVKPNFVVFVVLEGTAALLTAQISPSVTVENQETILLSQARNSKHYSEFE